jgi:hypothetical protein
MGHISFWLMLMMWIYWEITLILLKNTETLIDGSKEVGLEINIEKTKYMLLSRHQNVGWNREIKIANRLLGNVPQFKYLGTTVTDENLIQEEIKRRLNSGNACCHSVQNLLSSRLLSKNLKIRIYKTIILWGHWTSFHDAIAAGEGFLCAPFWGV